jgi:hypothetical protein
MQREPMLRVARNGMAESRSEQQLFADELFELVGPGPCRP